MLRSTRREISSKAFVSNSAGVIAICILLLATIVIIPQGNLYNGLLPSAYAQQGEEQERQAQEEEEEEETVAPEEQDEESTELFAAEIISNATEGVAPATFEFDANITGGTEPYTISWDFDDDGSEEESDDEEQTVLHTFEEAGTYNVTLTPTDSEDQNASDSIEINVEEPSAGEGRVTGLADLEELANFEGTDLEELEDLVSPRPNPTDPDTPEQSPAEDPPAEDPPAEDPPAEDPPAEDPPAEDPPAEDPPAEDPPAEEPTESGEGGEDRSGVEEIYPTARNGPVWYIKEQEDPTTDGYFYYGMYRTTTVDYIGSGVWHVDAETGSEEHGIRMHVDSPTGKWVNTEITGYFRVLTGDDQITMIARHGPSYHDDGGCQAYGYYGMTAVDGEVFFKKKLYHYDGGYTERLAQIDALENLIDRWVGMKFVVYDLENGDVKLELWIDEGDMTNNWNKVTELVDDGGLEVEGGDDCDRQSNHIIKDGTRSSYRVDDSEFDFKELSVREIQP
jgi:PKD repeat protein